MKTVESPCGSSKNILEKTKDQGGIFFQPPRFQALVGGSTQVGNPR